MADYAITNVTRRVVYTGSAGVGPYAFSFPVLVNTDIAVYKNSTLLTLTTDYTVTISGTTGQGSVTLVSAATGSDRITIVGARAIERSTDFVTGGDFFANTLNTELDSEVIFVQQVAETAERSLKAPVTDPTTINMTLPLNTVRANKTLAFDADGNPVVGEQIGDYRGNWAAGTAYNKRDLVKDTTTNNIYICLTAHTSTGSQPLTTNTDSAKWGLIVDASASTNAASNSSNSANNSSNFANNASNSANAASNSSNNASNFANNASNSANAASNAQTNVAANASAASNSANNASNFANNASNSANASSNHANNASNFANNASNSANSSSGFANNASNFANNASNSANAAAASSTTANTAANNASNASSNSSNFANNSSNSANAAALSANGASNSANNASNSANAAASAQVAAESARDATLTAYDNFDDRYLGSKTSDPTLDNDGNALVAGALYFNSVDGAMKVYTGSAWVAAYVSGTGFLSAANNLSDVANTSTARTNLGLSIGTNVQAYDAELAAIAGLTSAADKGIQFTGAGTAGTYDLTSAGKALLDDVDASAQRTTLGLAIGTNVQAYDAELQAISGLSANGLIARTSSSTAESRTITGTTNVISVTNGDGVSGNPTLDVGSLVARTDQAKTFTTSQRGTVTTDNDGSFDMNVTNNFTCTPTGTFTLTFTNITAGQSGYVLLVNTGGHAVSAASTTKVNTTFLTTVSAAGTYLLSYFSNGTNVYVTTGGAMA